MAIYSFNHDTFGRTTSAPGAAGQNASYNSRKDATRLAEGDSKDRREAGRNAAYNAREEVTYAVRSHIIPPAPDAAAAWFKLQEAGERKNARMSDRFIGALPRELSPEQSIEAVEGFCRRVTGDRVPWHFALHLELEKRPEPDWNPHAHIILRDRDIETGKRVLYTSAGPKERAKFAEQGIRFWTTTDFREAWGAEMNLALARAGFDVRVDHRTLEEQGINRKAQIHIGPASKAAADKGHEFASKDQARGDRAIPYSLLDDGTRADYNARIKEANRFRDALDNDALKSLRGQQQPTSQQEKVFRDLLREQRQTRQAMYAEQRQDKRALREAHGAEIAVHKGWARGLYAAARATAFGEVKAYFTEAWTEVRAIDDRAERDRAAAALKRDQKVAYDKVSSEQIDKARPVKDAAWKVMTATQEKERTALQGRHHQETATLARQHAAERSALQESWRARLQDRESSRISAQLTARQGLVASEAAARAIMRQHRRDQDRKLGETAGPSPSGPSAAKILAEHARSEHAARQDLRRQLNTDRARNQARAATMSKDNSSPATTPGKTLEHSASEFQTSSRRGGRSGR